MICWTGLAETTDLWVAPVTTSISSTVTATMSSSNSGQGVDTVRATSATYTLSANIGGLTFAGAGGFTGTGNSIANTITGGSDIDTLSGGGGNDTLVGLGGNDTLGGGARNDTFIATVGDGNDSYAGNGGSDTYSLAATTADAIVNLAAGTASSSQTGSDTLNSIENVIGGAGNDTITVSSDFNFLVGGAGSDTFLFRNRAIGQRSSTSRQLLHGHASRTCQGPARPSGGSLIHRNGSANRRPQPWGSRGLKFSQTRRCDADEIGLATPSTRFVRNWFLSWVVLTAGSSRSPGRDGAARSTRRTFPRLG
jgi:hypothetical protein